MPRKRAKARRQKKPREQGIVFVPGSLPEKCLRNDRKGRRQALWLLLHENKEVKQVREFVARLNKADIKTRNIVSRELKSVSYPKNISFLVELLRVDDSSIRRLISTFTATKGLAGKLLKNNYFLSLAREFALRHQPYRTKTSYELIKRKSFSEFKIKGIPVFAVNRRYLGHGRSLILGKIYVGSDFPGFIKKAYAVGALGLPFSTTLAEAFTISYARKKGLLKQLLEWEKRDYIKKFESHKSFIENFAPELRVFIPN